MAVTFHKVGEIYRNLRFHGRRQKSKLKLLKPNTARTHTHSRALEAHQTASCAVKARRQSTATCERLPAGQEKGRAGNFKSFSNALIRPRHRFSALEISDLWFIVYLRKTVTMFLIAEKTAR